MLQIQNRMWTTLSTLRLNLAPCLMLKRLVLSPEPRLPCALERESVGFSHQNVRDPDLVVPRTAF